MRRCASASSRVASISPACTADPLSTTTDATAPEASKARSVLRSATADPERSTVVLNWPVVDSTRSGSTVTSVSSGWRTRKAPTPAPATRTAATRNSKPRLGRRRPPIRASMSTSLMPAPYRLSGFAVVGARGQRSIRTPPVVPPWRMWPRVSQPLVVSQSTATIVPMPCRTLLTQLFPTDTESLPRARPGLSGAGHVRSGARPDDRPTKSSRFLQPVVQPGRPP